MIRLQCTPEMTRMALSSGHPLTNDVRAKVPGAKWNGTGLYWEFPSTRRVARALREFLRGHAADISMEESSRFLLASLADSEQGYDITHDDKSGNFTATFEFFLPYQEAMNTAGARLQADGSYLMNPKQAKDLLTVIEKRGLDLLPHPIVVKLLTAPPPPFLMYSGSLLSLSHASLEELEYVTNTPGKKRKTPLIKRLESLGIETPFDLLQRIPLRYIDRNTPMNIRELQPGQQAVIMGTITNVGRYEYQNKRSSITVKDSQGTTIDLSFFQQAWVSKQFHKGDEVIAQGKYEVYKARNGRSYPQLSSPRLDMLHSSRGSVAVVPVYPQSEKYGITTWDVMALQKETLSKIPDIREILPPELIAKHALINRKDAWRAIHFPRDLEEAEKARQRIIYEEMLELQLFIQGSKRELSTSTGITHNRPNMLAQEFMKSLPYELTNAQKKAISEIVADMARPHPMHRLVQGDVGSGKTSVAIATLLTALDNGYQSAMMAPTEILAEQLYNSTKQEIEKNAFLSPRTGNPVSIAFLAGKVTVKNRREMLARLASGELDIIVGTNALISQDVEYANLGLAVIDEQHRFGTEQRSNLRNMRKDGIVPDMLIMTATPVPRTGAVTLYGDLDLTILDELPAGRQPIKTEWIREKGEDIINNPFSQVWGHIIEQVQKGHQAYIVASLVEDNEKLAAQSVEDAYEALKHGHALPGLRIGRVHGKMARSERDETMGKFSAGEIDVLVSTTVIEVGVNVPNATIMVVLDAGRFGIAQLHQIRGRVGRSKLPSWCYLVSDTDKEVGMQRLQALVDSTDGFYLAEVDLEIRGEGTLFGRAQTGVNDLRIASLKDKDILEHARTDAEEILSRTNWMKDYPELSAEVDFFFGGKQIEA